MTSMTQWPMVICTFFVIYVGGIVCISAFFCLVNEQPILQRAPNNLVKIFEANLRREFQFIYIAADTTTEKHFHFFAATCT